jgi:hypothetical protein
MPAKRLPETDEDRINALKAIIEQEELSSSERDPILQLREFQELRKFLLSFEGTCFCFKQAMEDETKADSTYVDLFKNAQLYISHFIQVLNLAIIRGEIKTSALLHYGLEHSNEFSVPDLSTEEAIVEWGDRLIQGELGRASQGGIPIYNPAISKVRVHYDLFKDALYSLKIYRKNTLRTQEELTQKRDEADRLILNVWNKVENKYWGLPEDERNVHFKIYGLKYDHYRGEQLNMFG